MKAKKPGRPKATTERLALNLRLPKGATAKLKRAAEADCRPLASWITRTLLEAAALGSLLLIMGCGQDASPAGMGPDAGVANDAQAVSDDASETPLPDAIAQVDSSSDAMADSAPIDAIPPADAMAMGDATPDAQQLPYPSKTGTCGNDFQPCCASSIIQQCQPWLTCGTGNATDPTHRCDATCGIYLRYCCPDTFACNEPGTYCLETGRGPVCTR